MDEDDERDFEDLNYQPQEDDEDSDDSAHIQPEVQAGLKTLVKVLFDSMEFSDCPVCECPKDELDRTDMFYPLRHTEEVKAAVYDARKELLEKDGTVKQGNKAKVSHTISHMLSHTISHHKDIAHDIASLSRYHILYHIRYRTRYRIKDIT